jgi:hypothetical protein
MTTIQKLEAEINAAKQQIDNIDHPTRCAYVNAVGMKALYQQKEAELLKLLGEHPAPLVLHISNSLSHIHGLTQFPIAADLVITKSLLELAESTAAFKAAYELIQPKVDEISRLEKDLQAERGILERKRVALIEAKEAAAERGRLAALEDPAVLAAEAALAALERPQAAPARKSKTIGEAQEVS